MANYGDNTVSVLLGNGSGGFGAKTDFATGPHPYSVAVGDFNGDGEDDLAVANATPCTVSVLLGNGSGGFGAKTDFATGTQPTTRRRAADFNGDGKLDLAVANYGANTVSVLLNATAPVTTDNAPAGWQNTSPVTVTLTPTDFGSGMSGGPAATQYKIDGATSWSIGTSVLVSGDGVHTIRYRSIDAAGLVEDTERAVPSR